MKLKDKVFYIESPKDIYKYSKETISKIVELAKANKKKISIFVREICVYCHWHNVTIEDYIDIIYNEQINKN